jgi:Fusaric acid resistance protein-like
MVQLSVVSFIRRHDPDGYALRRAVRIAIVAPALFAIALKGIGDAEVATFAGFGSFALLLFVDFPGSGTRRLSSYLMLGVVGTALIALGTLASQNTWLAAASMVVVGFAVLFAGVLSATIAAAASAALLTFILPVSLPADPSAIGLRLGGWAMALAGCIPAALLLFPPRVHDALRADAAAVCEALGRSITTRLGVTSVGAPKPAPTATTSDALRRLRKTFRSTTYRPVGLSTGSRALVRLVEELEWLHGILVETEPDAIVGWPDTARQACVAAAGVLTASGRTLDAGRTPTDADVAALSQALADLHAARTDAVVATRVGLASPDGVMRPYQAHEIAYAAALTGTTVAWAAAADRRPLVDRLLGRPPANYPFSRLVPARRLLGQHIDRHSVWLRNSIRGGIGLGLAVLVSQLIGAQHAFWVVLGTMSVLRSNALSTGSTALRAVGGTAAGFAVGGLLVYLIGTNDVVLWILLPIAVLFAAFAPAAISFAFGQAGFTVVVVILFNLIQPAGWKVGLVRIEDVALGGACSLLVGLLFWPRGATGAIHRALREAYDEGASYIERAIRHVTYRAPEPSTSFTATLAASSRLDDALRQYLAERGVKNMPLEELTKAVNGATRLRLAGQAIVDLRRDDPPVDVAFFEDANTVLTGRAAQVSSWYAGVGARFDGSREAVQPPSSVGTGPSVYELLRQDLLTKCSTDDHLVDHARRLLWIALYLRDLQVLEGRLAPVIDRIADRAAAAPAPFPRLRRASAGT